MSLGSKIRSLRQSKNWSQAQLAGKLGVHPKHVSRYENSVSKPSFDVLRKIGEIFGVTTDYLLVQEPEPKNQVIEGLPVLRDRELLNYLEKVDQLDDEDRNLAKNMLEAVLARNQIRKLKKEF